MGARVGSGARAAALVLLVGAVLVAGWRLAPHGGEADGGPSPAPPAPSSGAERPILVERRPVVEPLAALGEQEPAGAHARWIRLNNEATRVLEDGELERAVEMFDRCRAAEPGRDVFRRNLAEALARLARRDRDRGELEEAIGHLARALELAPEREDADALGRQVERWRREVELERDQWTEASDLFELSYDTKRDDLLQNSQRVLDHLERAYDELRLWFDADPVRELGRAPIRVVLYGRADFGRVTGLGDWAGGAFDGVVRVSVEDLGAQGERWRRVLTHELVHAFVHEVGNGRVPGWLNEGLAQFLERDDAALAAAREARIGELIPLERLRGSLVSWSDRAEIARAYAQSLLLVERIATQYGEDALRRMIEGCAEGIDPAESFEAWTSVPLGFAHGLLREG